VGQRPKRAGFRGLVLRFRLQTPETVIFTCSATSLQVSPRSRSSKISCMEAG
jgi:hypothetical protein